MTRRVLYTSRTVKLDGLKAYRELIAMLYTGQVPKWDTSGVRPAGATRSEPLAAGRLAQNLLRICSASPLKSFAQLLDESLVPSSVTISAVRLRRSSLLEALGRSALISLSNLTDDRIRRAKSRRVAG